MCICRYQIFQFIVIIFGPKKSQVTFQKMMDRILRNVANVQCYVDDVDILLNYTKEHASHLEIVFPILNNNEFSLRIKKCLFIRASAKLIEHSVEKNGVHVDEEKVEALRDAISPTTRSFLGLA